MSDNQSGKSSASKTTKRVTANRNVFSGADTGKSTSGSSVKTKTSKSGNKKQTAAKAVGVTAVSAGAVKAAKKMGGRSIAVILVCFIIALAIGAGICFFLGKNDKFEFIGNEELSFTLGETYADDGVEIKELGFDISKKASVKTNLKQNEQGEYFADEAGTYYMIYTVKSIKFGFVYPTQKIRLITFVEPSEGENYNG